jgi:Protein of unknown function (DUF429)
VTSGAIVGVDFSGARNAGRLIWIAEGVDAGGALRIESCRPAMELDGGSRRRDDAIQAVAQRIRETGPAVVGLDFPFGLPESLADEATWFDFATSFGRRYVSAEEFKRICLERAGGRELRRLTDLETRTPFSPYNLRLYRQTYYGIRDLLAPLVTSNDACVLPMQSPVPGKTWLVEICPASTLKSNLPHVRNYKNRSVESSESRQRILRWLEGGPSVILTDAVRNRALMDSHGDAVDSVIAAYAAWRALKVQMGPVGSERYQREGFVFEQRPTVDDPKWGRGIP